MLLIWIVCFFIKIHLLNNILQFLKLLLKTCFY
nr:MAG TPA: hypothetical protein [Caudoviricetes sp.]